MTAFLPRELLTANRLNTELGAKANSPIAQADVANLVSDLAAKAPIASPTFTGTPAAPTAAGGTNTTQIATTAFVTTALAAKANLASPTFTGTPAAPTAANGTNTTQLATCAFVQSAIALLVASSPAALDTLNELAAALGNDANFSTTIATSLGLKAPLASPALTGTPTAPTAAGGTNTTQIATTAFVTSGLAAKADLASPALTGTPTAPTAANGTNTTQIATTAYVQTALAGAGIGYTPVNKAGDTMTGRLVSALGTTTGNNGIATATAELGEFKVMNNGTGASMIAFHRSLSHAAYFGLDTDNAWKVGGWSMGAVAYKLYHEGNKPAIADVTGLQTALDGKQAAGSYLTSSSTAIAKAWVRFNGTGTPAIAASLNVTSITDNGVGDYTVNFTSAFADTNYSMAGSCTIDLTTNVFGSTYLSVYRGASAIGTGSIRLNTVGISGGSPTLYDCSVVCAQFFR